MSLPGKTLAMLLAGAAFGCQGQTSPEPPIVPIRNMHEVPRYDPQERSFYFNDHRTMRPELEGTVPREAEIDGSVATGIDDEGQYVLAIPGRVDEAMVRRGQDRYAIYCVPCHGGLGDGQGMVPNVSGVPAIRPPTFHDERIRQMPDGQMFVTISRGVRNMPAYAAQIPVSDRWAIVAYVRALQHAELDRRTAMNTEAGR